MGAMQPVHLSSGSALRPPAPPAVGSPAFQHALDEVRQRAASGDPQGLARARRWEMTSGALVAGHWDTVALDLAAQHRLSGADTSRVLAQTLGAALDANIACHDAKYTYWLPRPSQVEARIKPLIGLPNHPSYPSNHSCDSGAAAFVLAALFPAEGAQLIAQAQDAGESRIDAGLHYRFDLEAGLQIARAAAAAALAEPATKLAGAQP
jgi:membrane-associated phospholipid phosphatase